MNPRLLILPLIFAAAAAAQAQNAAAPDWFAATALPRSSGPPPPQAAVFLKFAPRVSVTWDDKYLYVQDNGLPDHGMMMGITAWQQQVPLPQAYFGENAWAIPLHPVPAQHPQSLKNNFLRGAVAVAADGIPIFNPQNNRGEVSQDIGELDHWGGHCGRADDYHYHVAPLYLQRIVGAGQPIGYALDGYPIYGPTEPDGSAPVGLDEFNGNTTPELGYHYHASTKYPYVMGGFHGEVAEVNGQVDPQPRAQPIRPAQPPLPGATITGFTAGAGDKSFALQYVVSGQPAAVNYFAVGNGAWRFEFSNADGTESQTTYRPGDGGRRPPPPPNPPASNESAGPAPEFKVAQSGTFVLRSPVVANGDALPVEFTGDGAGISPPLEWSGAPSATQCYAVIMHHIDKEGVTKWYWTLYNIPASVHSLAKNVRGVGTLGSNSVNDEIAYAPPHSKGPGAKTYTLTIYALSGPAKISRPASEVNRAVLLEAMKDLILDSSVLKVVYDRTGVIDKDGGERPPRPNGQTNPAPQ